MDSILITGEAGWGKTFICMSRAIGLHGVDNILVVAAWNSICINVARAAIEGNFGNEKRGQLAAITFHDLNGEVVGDVQVKNKRPHDVMRMKDGVANPYKIIIIEEIMLLTHKQLIKLQAFKAAHPEIEFCATGDENQLEAIDDEINNARKLRFLRHPTMFPTQLPEELRPRKNMRVHCKKPKCQELGRFNEGCATCKQEQLLMEQLYSACHKCKTYEDMKKFIKEYIPESRHVTMAQMRDEKIYQARTYFAESATTLNAHIHSYTNHTASQNKITLSNNVCYYRKEHLICKTKLQIKGRKMRVNFIYKIESLNANSFTLRDPHRQSAEADFVLTHEQILRCFSLPYCNTVHSTQGDKINNKFVIADFSDYVTKNWLYTSISRATSLGDIYILTESLFLPNEEALYTRMIQGYQQQDRAKGRTWRDEEYINTDDCRRMFSQTNGICPGCGTLMPRFQKKAKNLFTVDRINNDLAHTKTNCKGLCKKCNCNKSNR
jgi:hypothetical protein